MPIRTTPRPPMINLEALKGFIYGPPKVGKTSFLSGMDGVLFALYEDGAKHLHVRNFQPAEGVDTIRSWADVQLMYKELRELKEAGTLDITCIAHDTADIMFDLCRQSIFGQKQIEHESDLGYGKGWDLVAQKFRNTILAFEGLGIGQWFTSHTDWKEIANHRGSKRHKSLPTVNKKARETLIGLADVIIFADAIEVEGERKHVAFCHPDQSYEAGGRYMRRMPEMVDLKFSEFRRTFLDVNAGAIEPPKRTKIEPPPALNPEKEEKPAPSAITHKETVPKETTEKLEHPRDLVNRLDGPQVRALFNSLRPHMGTRWLDILKKIGIAEPKEEWAPKEMGEARRALIHMVPIARELNIQIQIEASA